MDEFIFAEIRRGVERRNGSNSIWAKNAKFRIHRGTGTPTAISRLIGLSAGRSHRYSSDTNGRMEISHGSLMVPNRRLAWCQNMNIASLSL